MQPLVIDTDPGVDDAHALMMAFAHPAARVAALTTLAGLAAFALLVVSGAIQCGKCRNRRFSDRNVRGYAENDRSVIDVRDSAVMKRKIG